MIISSTHQTHAQQMFSNVPNPHMQWLLPLSPFGSFYDVLRSKFICVHYEIRPVFLATIWKCTDSFDYYCHILKCKLAFSLCSSIKISVEFETSSWVDHCINFHPKKSNSVWVVSCIRTKQIIVLIGVLINSFLFICEIIELNNSNSIHIIQIKGTQYFTCVFTRVK